ncbi:MAG: type I DNA topoisomerase [Candidatus Omnitrophica bacterium]|nr:type I DNA topoisomerase [Candidatus Omnitrophota bacterium]
MGKHLIIVESPAKAKTINKYLGSAYKVEASMGHVRDLPRNRLGVDLDNDFTPQYVIVNAKKKIVSRLKKARKNIESIYLAADPDREGEAICLHLDWILKKGFKGEIKRVTFNEITPTAVREAFRHPRPINVNLFNAQQARRILDRIVGYKLSPLLWKKIARGLSAGRVQSVTLRLIIDREREIKNFQSKEYWSLDAEFASQKEKDKDKVFKAHLEKISNEKIDLANKEDVDVIINSLENATYRVKYINEKKKKRKPQPPFITSKLQQEAYNKLRFPAQKTMMIAQRLYEGIELGKEEGSVGLITYMRTDSVHVSKTALGEVRTYIEKTFGREYLCAKPRIFKSRKRAQEAHEAVRPTSVIRTPETIKQYLKDDEFKLYDLIWKRFVSTQMSDAEYLVHTVDIEALKKYLFRTASTTNTFPGFTKVYAPSSDTEDDDKKEDKQQYVLPHLSVGEIVDLRELFPEQHFTKPPARFNDASLVKTLEELGIGRPSTYAPTVRTLLGRSYIERRSAAFHPTEMGELVIDLLMNHFAYLLDVNFTAHMEDELDEVEAGKKEWTTVLKEFYTTFSPTLKEAEEKLKSVKKTVIETKYSCDTCGKPMVMKWGRFGKFLACAGFPECKYTKSIPTGYRCPTPDCNGELVRRQSKRRSFFYGCSNYPTCTYVINKLPHKDEETSSQATDPHKNELPGEVPQSE